MMQGKKTHEQHLRTLERKEDVPSADRVVTPNEATHTAKQNVRESEFAVSRGGLHQESDHNKHNDPGQSGHKPQQHTAAEEKH